MNFIYGVEDTEQRTNDVEVRDQIGEDLRL